MFMRTRVGVTLQTAEPDDLHIVIFHSFWLQLLVKFPSVAELPVNSVYARPGPAR